jgi:peptidyl-prolyl cis-trans isomerase B (cyclophilin B)
VAAVKREKALARQRGERQAARRAAARARRRQRTAVLASVVAVLVVAAGLGVLVTGLSGGDDTAEPVAQATVAPSASASLPPGTCRYEAAGTAARRVHEPPTEGVETSGTYVATMVLDAGTVVFEMDAAKAPCTVNSLRSLAHFGFFDDTPCPRLTSQVYFVLQCGDPKGDGTGGPGYRFGDEALEGATYPRGTVAMANGGKDTKGSQFFLVYKDSGLPPDYTPFGRVTSGLDVLDAIARRGSQPAGDGRPRTPVTVQTLRTAAA